MTYMYYTYHVLPIGELNNSVTRTLLSFKSLRSRFHSFSLQSIPNRPLVMLCAIRLVSWHVHEWLCANCGCGLCSAYIIYILRKYKRTHGPQPGSIERAFV